jgi:1,4-alpha-glucan branching enzyme
MPVMEHPLYESWGYQLTGYFAPTSRYGTPQDLMYLIDYLHQQGIGVILDWVPAHFATDAHGLWRFDGTPLYEHPDRARGYHPVWQTGIFNYGRGEVQSFLISNALFWLDLYHIDMLRVDGVSSMVYLNHMEREALEAGDLSGENSDAVGFLRRFNEVVYGYHGDIHTIAEESDAWPQVSSPTYVGGLGFGIKWNMGWMHDVLFYLGRHPAQRPAHHDELVSLLSYAFNENYVLSLSHDEVCSGKNSLLKKMPGSNAEQFANLRLLLGFMFAHPGKKLLFMQGEFGQQREWNPQGGLDWHLLDNPAHQGIARWVGDCAHLYKSESACHRLDCAAEGFEWVDASDRENSVVSFVRWSGDRSKAVLVVCNFSAQSFNEYRIGVPFAGAWRELLNSNAAEYGGWGEGNGGMVMSQAQPFHGHAQSLPLRLPQLTMLFFRPGEA